MSKKGSEVFCVECLMSGLKKRVWEQQAPQLSPEAARILAPPAVTKSRGIGAAVRGQEKKHELETNLQSMGLQDLSNLMSHAKEMAQLARATNQRLDKKSTDNTQMDEVAKLRGIMMNLGNDRSQHHCQYR